MKSHEKIIIDDGVVKYSEIYYFDGNDEICDKSVAAHAIIREIGYDGDLIQETYLDREA